MVLEILRAHAVALLAVVGEWILPINVIEHIGEFLVASIELLDGVIVARGFDLVIRR